MKHTLTFALLLLPLQLHAASFKDLVGEILEFNQLLTVLIFALTFLVLAWKIIEAWIIKGGEPEAVEKGKKTVFIGIIVLVIMSGLWGILEILSNIL